LIFSQPNPKHASDSKTKENHARTIKIVDARQVDVRDVCNVREVVGQIEPAAVAEVDGVAAMPEADVADEANDAAGKPT
jgi:hypothetical protein